MKKIFSKIFGSSTRMRIKENWENLMHSTKKKMALGAQQISRMMPCAHKDSWRRSRK